MLRRFKGRQQSLTSDILNFLPSSSSHSHFLLLGNRSTIPLSVRMDGGQRMDY